MFDALLRRRGTQVINFVNPVLQRLSHSESAVVQSKPKIKALITQDRRREKKIFKKHFVEKLFINHYQYDVVEYPEIQTIEEVESLIKHCEFAKIVVADSPNEEISNESEAKKVLAKIKKFDLTGFKLPNKQKGFGYMESEYLLMQEALSSDLSLAKTIAENEEFGIQLINLFGNELQKEQYLLKLASGEIMTCFAHLESKPLVTIDPITVETTATLSSDGESYVISGKKNWVYNASHADILIVSASVGEDKKPTLFIVDKNTKGIQIHKPIPLAALKGLDVCEVSFDEVRIPATSVLGELNEGEKLIKQILINGKLSVGAQCIGAMRKLISMAIKHCIHNKLFKKNKYERMLYETKIGYLVGQLYSLESMTYLIAGRVDSFDEADVFTESLLLKIFASESLQYVLNETILILGPKAFENNPELNQLFTDCQYFAGCDVTNDHLKQILSTIGCEYALKYKQTSTAVQKFKDTMNMQTVRKKGIDLQDTLNTREILKGYIHLMFQQETHTVEDSVFRLKDTINHLLKKHGEGILNNSEVLKMLADMAVCVYVMTASLARASRAYCLAVKRQDVDDFLVRAQVLSAYNKLRDIQDILTGFGDLELFKKFDSEVLETKGYSGLCSITSNFKVKT